jgi:hypothetical protein
MILFLTAIIISLGIKFTGFTNIGIPVSNNNWFKIKN